MSEDLFNDIDELSEDDDLTISSNEAEKYEHFRFVVDKGQSPMRVDKYLTMHIVGISRNRIQLAADAEGVLANGKVVKSNYKIKPNDTITLVLSYPKNEFEIIPEDIPLNVVYEDDDVMVINKDAGMVVHPGFGNFDGTIANAIAYRLKDTPEYDPENPRPGIVHRIDKDTSGLIVVAKNIASKKNLSDQFFEKTTKRKYVALVWGNVKEDEGTIESYIGRDLKNRLRMASYPDESIGKYAKTHYKVLDRIGYVSLVECRLETGRTHQIRVHMQSIGHTLFNDERYGGSEILKGTTFSKYRQFVANCFKICPRQALHAQTLGFKHPKTGEELLFESELPEDMKQVVDKWKNYIASSNI